jgi:RecB family exonuclease
VVHALAQLVAEGVLPPDADQLLAQLDAVWSSLGFDAPWQREREREQAREALCRFVAWAKGNPRQPLAAEAGFEVNIGDVILRGSVDRLEIDADGRIHIVDFKTGRTPRRNEDVLVDPQLGVYQLVARAGGFDQIADPPGASNELGGAELVWLRNERAGGLPQVQRQPPLEGEPPTWADQLVSGTGEAVRKELFPARPGSSCTVCAFRPLCPAHDSGAQVVS